jgi:glycosyltransferase involved in cell wall biosynthesis
VSVLVHLAPFLQGGAGRAVATLACAQQRSGNDVIVATSKTGEPGFENYGEYVDTIRASGCRLIEVDSLFKRDRDLNEAALSAVIATLGAARPAVVHAHAAIPARIGQGLGGPVLQTMHGWSRHKSAAHTAEDLAIMSAVDLVVFPSKAAHRQLQDIGGRFRRTAIVPNGISATPPAAPLPGMLSDLPARRSAGTKVLLSIGSLTTQKNHRVIIDAMPALADEHDVLAVLIGEGPELEPLRERASTLGVADRVRFCGYMHEASSALSIADLLIQPSLAESFGVAVVEAFRAGVPVAASTIPPLIELVSDTDCGWTFRPDSPEALADVVREVLAVPRDQREERIDRARRLFADRYTDDRMIGAYESLYTSLR